MPDFFLIKKLLAALVLPPTGPLLLACVGLACARRRWGRVLAWLSVLTLFALGSPPVARVLVEAASGAPFLAPAAVHDAQAIVILGGGVREGPEYGGDVPDVMTLDRLRYGAWLARRSQLPVLVSGGAVYRGVAEASAMRAVLQHEFGVAVRWTEADSLDTAQNARRSARMLLPEGVRRIALVTDQLHMARARAEFAAAGFEVIAAPVGLSTGWSAQAPLVLRLVPNMTALRASHYALYSLLGDWVRRLGIGH